MPSRRTYSNYPTRHIDSPLILYLQGKRKRNKLEWKPGGRKTNSWSHKSWKFFLFTWCPHVDNLRKILRFASEYGWLPGAFRVERSGRVLDFGTSVISSIRSLSWSLRRNSISNQTGHSNINKKRWILWSPFWSIDKHVNLFEWWKDRNPALFRLAFVVDQIKKVITGQRPDRSPVKVILIVFRQYREEDGGGWGSFDFSIAWASVCHSAKRDSFKAESIMKDAQSGYDHRAS
jgi:hypothetical protein